MEKKELVVLVGKHSGNSLISTDTFYFRFFTKENRKIIRYEVDKKTNETTKGVFERLFQQFLQKKLISVGYDTYKKKEEYYGLKLQNEEENQLSIYFTSKALEVFSQFEEYIEQRKIQDFQKYAQRPIDKNMVNRFSLRPTLEDRSSILYILDDQKINYFRKRKELGYYYRKKNGQIDSVDVKIICDLVRYFINKNLEHHPYYCYKQTPNHLLIYCDSNVYIEVIDEDLIELLEKNRILDDLWLVNHQIIDEMPTQEDSINQKEELIRKKVQFNKRKNFS